MSKKRAPGQITHLSSRIFLVLLGIGFALAMAELGARQFLGRPYTEDNGDLWQCDRLLGWRGKPNTSTEINTEGYIHEFVRNSAGMHDQEHQREKPEGVFRILVIGDSFVEARQVAKSQTSSSILETALNSDDSNLRYEVISAGASAWGPAQELMYFRSEGKFFSPDLVLGFWYPANDLLDVLPDHRMTFAGTNCYAPYFAICNEAFDPEPWFSSPGISPALNNCSPIKKLAANALHQLYLHSRLYQHLEPLLAGYQPRIRYNFNFSPWLEGTPDPILDYAYTVTDHIYAELNDETARIGGKVALVVVPVKEAIYYEADGSARQQLEVQYPSLKDSNPRLPNQRLSSLMAARSIPVFDLQPSFAAHLKGGGGVLYGDVDSHWNVPGNQLAGQLIAQWLIDNHLVPATN
ncbi:MAG: SGNH/GDSL hydrolase family protein [Chloroflexi bacterium]|nr:SGNH/GDSL hydrolase family protein [Chloroflexota bacterium]